MTPAEFERQVGELARTMPRSNAERYVRTKHQHPGLTGKALELAANGVPLQEQIQRERSRMATEEAQATEAKGKGGRKPDPNSNRQQALAAAIKVMKRAKGPLTRAEIHERAVKAGVDLGMKAKGTGPVIGGLVNDAMASGTVIDGHVIVRPERGKYSVEKATA